MANKFILPIVNDIGDGELIATSPVTLTDYKARVLSLPSASIPGYQLRQIYVSPYISDNLVECNFLNKILCAPDYSIGIQVSDNGINWTGSYGWLPNYEYEVPAQLMAVSNEIKIICAINKPGSYPNPQNQSNYDYGGGVMYSYDAHNWFTGSMDGFISAKSMCYSPSLQRFVAVGDSTRAWYSDNGINWYLTTSSRSINNYQPFANSSNATTDPATCTWRAVTWDSVNGKFIAVGDREDLGIYNTGSVMTSSDGIIWSINPTAITNIGSPDRITTGNGIIVVVGNNKLWTSLDAGNSWVSASATEVLYSRINDIAYSPTLNKFYAPYSAYYLPSEFLHFFTSSNGTDWDNYSCSLNINEVIGEYQFLPQRHQSNYSTPRSLIWSTNLQKFIGIINDNGQRSVLYSDSEGLNFIGSNESDVANVQFRETPPANLFSSTLTGYTGSSIYPMFTTDNDPYAWIEFDFMKAVTDPTSAGDDNYYYPTASLGIIVDSGALSEFTFYPSARTEQVEVDSITYIQETNAASDGFLWNYYEKSVPPITSASTSTFSGSFKASGRDYVAVWYGIYGDETDDSVGMILNLKDGIVEYYEDSTNFENPNSYYMTNYAYPFVFINKPKLIDKTNGYWELTFKVGFDRYLAQNRQLLHTGSITFTETDTLLPYVYPIPSRPPRTFTPQSASLYPVTTPIPHHWWRADYGLTTSGWLASSGSINFTFTGVNTANSTVGAYFSQSFGSSSILSSDINAKHIFIRADNILARGAVMGSTVNNFHQLMFCLSLGTNNWVISQYTSSGGGLYQVSGFQTGSKLTYIEFDMYNRTYSPAPVLYKDNWSLAFTPNINGSANQTGTYTNQFTWSSGSRMLIGRRQYNDVFSYANLYIKEIAIFTSSISIGEAHKLSQEMLARWP